ncbi:SMR family transporter [Sedimentitalea sp.]|uniref:DMT family transporter n=1 Tax=Sedimentitalea sp. TaxID=2048915 RepID=UPI003298BC35
MQHDQTMMAVGLSRLLGLALRSIPLGTGYEIWTGIATNGTVTSGIAFLAEPAKAGRLLCVLLILAGIVGLKLLSGS